MHDLSIVFAVWVAGTLAANLYAQQIGVAWGSVLGLLPAFLLEAAFYVALGRDDIRALLEKLPPPTLAFWMWVTALSPFVAAGLAGSVRASVAGGTSQRGGVGDVV